MKQYFKKILIPWKRCLTLPVQLDGVLSEPAGASGASLGLGEPPALAHSTGALACSRSIIRSTRELFISMEIPGSRSYSMSRK